MQFRILKVEEWKDYPEIAEAFESRGVAMPIPQFAMIAAAFMESDPPKLVGFQVWQFQIHAEPLVLFNPYALRGLVECGENDLKQRLGNCTYYACSTDPRMDATLETMGFSQTPYTLWHKAL